MLLGRPWIHANWIMPSTLHQCLNGVYRETTIQGGENYFTNAFLYQEISEHKKNHCLTTMTVAMRQIQRLKETRQLLWLVNQL